jgi:hypothetical protein
MQEPGLMQVVVTDVNDAGTAIRFSAGPLHRWPPLAACAGDRIKIQINASKEEKGGSPPGRLVSWPFLQLRIQREMGFDVLAKLSNASQAAEGFVKKKW